MSLRILENVPLAPMTTLKVGGPARYFVEAATEDDVAEAFEHAAGHGFEVFVLGGGSNILVADTGFDGLVIQIGLKGIAVRNQRSSEGSLPNGGASDTSDGVLITASAGEGWDTFVAYCVENDLAGVECLSGIPGSVGGTPVQNVGAYGQEVSETIVSVRCFDRVAGKIAELTNEQCGFEYRKSIFNSTERDRYVVLSAVYRLTPGGVAKIVYKDLVDHFDGRKPTLRETRAAVLKIRGAKSMVIDPADPNSRSAGSFFKNPIVPVAALESMIEGSLIPNVPHFRLDGETVKIPAAWLIENAGFAKGHARGNAGISSNHSLAIINRGSATAAEIVSLKNDIQKAVFEKFGIELQPEPVFVGFGDRNAKM